MVVFDDGVAEKGVGGFVEGLAGRGRIGSGYEVDLDVFSDMHASHSGVAQVGQGALDGFALRVEDGLFRSDDELGFHEVDGRNTRNGRPNLGCWWQAGEGFLNGIEVWPRCSRTGEPLQTGGSFVRIHDMNLLPLSVTRRMTGWFLALGILGIAARGPIAGVPLAAEAESGPPKSGLEGPSRIEATLEKPFENSLGMKFVPVPGTPVLFSVWETRVRDFDAFVRETGYSAITNTYSLGTNRWKIRGDTWQSPGFPQTDRHPVCGVSWEDAQAFCAWLSKKEGRSYRLPTDVEWSLAVGLPEESGTTPKERSGQIPNRFPWGQEMPPLTNGLPAGNYPGAEASETNWPAGFRVIEDFRDPFARTAPVGSFPPQTAGLHDLGGNVWEWCEDPFEPGKEPRVVRGGSWVDNLPDLLLSTYRHFGRPQLRNVSIGFRCVLAPGPQRFGR